MTKNRGRRSDIADRFEGRVGADIETVACGLRRSIPGGRETAVVRRAEPDRGGRRRGRNEHAERHGAGGCAVFVGGAEGGRVSADRTRIAPDHLAGDRARIGDGRKGGAGRKLVG